MFSFLVPVYNSEKYLDECIESLLCQNGAEYEIILIDDGSTDNSGQICDDYEKKYPETIKVIHKENEGSLLTRRRGFKEAEGEWFICVDSDDYVDKDLLETVVNTINKFDPDMIIYNFQYVTDSGETKKSRIHIPSEVVFQGKDKQYIYSQRLLTVDISGLPCKVLKRNIVDIEKDYSGVGIRSMCEDDIQNLALFSNANRIIYLEKPMYYYRKGHESMTATHSYEYWLALKISFLCTEEYLDIWGVSDELKQRFYTRNAEVLIDFLRWAAVQNESTLPKTLAEIIHDVCIHPAFYRCFSMYNKSFAKTRYLAFCIPVLLSFVKKENCHGIRSFIRIEKVLSSKRKG